MLRLSRWFAVVAVLFIPLSAGAQAFCPPVAYPPSYGYGGSGYAPSYGYGGSGYAPSYGYGGSGHAPRYGYGGAYGSRYNPGGLGGPGSGLGLRPGPGFGGFGPRR